MPQFSKQQRLLKKPQFDNVMNHGIKVVCGDYVLIASQSVAPDKQARLGLVVSRKVGGSVERNRIKRCVRDSFRMGHPKNLKGRDLVVIARPRLTSPDGMVTRNARKSFEHCLERLNARLAQQPKVLPSVEA